MRRHPLRFALLRSVLVIGSALLLAACGGTAAAHPCGSNVAATDRPLPSFTGELLDGTGFSTDDFAEGIVVVNVWGSWCPPCQREAPELADAAGAFAEDGVRFLGVDIKDNVPAAVDFENRYGIPYPSVFDEEGRFSADLRVASPPMTYVVKDGTITTTITGQTDSSTIACAVRQVSPARGADGGDTGTEPAAATASASW